MAPAGTPKEIVDKIAQEIAERVKEPEFASPVADWRRSARRHP